MSITLQKRKRLTQDESRAAAVAAALLRAAEADGGGTRVHESTEIAAKAK